MSSFPARSISLVVTDNYVVVNTTVQGLLTPSCVIEHMVSPVGTMLNLKAVSGIRTMKAPEGTGTVVLIVKEKV